MTCFAKRPSVTALNLELRLPRPVRGPLERFAFWRLASTLLEVTDLGRRVGDDARPLILRLFRPLWFGVTKSAGAVSNSCPVIGPLASVAVFWLPPESRK
jgi:hypothetical protein